MPQLEVIKPNGEIEFFSLASDSGVVNIGSDPQNEIVLSGPNVAPFHAFLDYRQTPPRFVLLGQDQAWSPSPLEIDGYTLVYLERAPLEVEPALDQPDIVPLKDDELYYDFLVDKLQPQRRVIGWLKSFAPFVVSITNTGNQKAKFMMQGSAEEAACNFEFALPGQPVNLTGQVAFDLLPEEKIAVPVKVIPVTRAALSLRPVKHYFTLTVNLSQSDHMPRSILGELVCRPLIGPGMLILMVTVLLILGWFGLPALLEPLRSNPPIIAARVNRADEVKLFPFSRQVDSHPETITGDVDRPDTRLIPYERMFKEIAPKYGLDWHTLEALAYYESRMNYLAVGRAGDMGLMQIIPATWGRWAPKVNATDPFDPYSNIQVGALFLAEMREFCALRGYTDPRWMLVAYNWGPNRLAQFWSEGGTWAQIPIIQRNYAAGIVELATQRAATTVTFEEFYPDIAANVESP